VTDSDDRPDWSAVFEDLANRAVRAFRSLLHGLTIRSREYVLLVQHEPSELRQLVDTIEFHESHPALVPWVVMFEEAGIVNATRIESKPEASVSAKGG
jgi:hypothetical protein